MENAERRNEIFAQLYRQFKQNHNSHHRQNIFDNNGTLEEHLLHNSVPGEPEDPEKASVLGYSVINDDLLAMYDLNR